MADAPGPCGEAELETRLRELAAARYHDRHPFNQRLHRGELSPGELRTWVASRFYYQCNIPVKDALVLAKLPLPAQRRSWVRRIRDHDGVDGQEGGIERWLRLGEAVGLDRQDLLAHRHLLPGVRLAVDGYVNFCRNGNALEAVASSLTELCAPSIMLTRPGPTRSPATELSRPSGKPPVSSGNETSPSASTSSCTGTTSTPSTPSWKPARRLARRPHRAGQHPVLRMRPPRSFGPDARSRTTRRRHPDGGSLAPRPK
ncbi:thiaminase II/PqqC family protein [Streptomyces tendae]|uniref:hypothetical protein n=1 Tax=Streptomyces tendae TaxID=1932 RepID=UPI00365C517B